MLKTRTFLRCAKIVSSDVGRSEAKDSNRLGVTVMLRDGQWAEEERRVWRRLVEVHSAIDHGRLWAEGR